MPLLRIVMGREPSVSAAELPGFSVRHVEGADFPMLVASPKGTAIGILVENITKAEQERLNFYEAGFVFDLMEQTVETNNGPKPTMVYRARGLSPSEVPWDLDTWVANHGAMTVEAAAEIMRAHDAGMSVETLTQRQAIIRARAHSTISTSQSRRPETISAGATRAEVTIHETRHPYEAFFRVDEVTLSHKAHDGGEVGPIDRAVFVVTDAVTVLPYDPVRDRVLLIEQIRIGALVRGDQQPWMLEPVAGMIDAGETPEQTALRETHEEAGLTLTPTNLHHISTYYPSPGGIAQRFVSYVAVCDLPDAAAGLGGESTEHEDLRAHLVPFDTLMEMVRSGEAANAALIISAQWLQAERNRLQAGA